MLVGVRRLGPALCLLAWLVCPFPAFAGDDAPDWELVSLPGGRAGFLPEIGMTTEVPVAVVTGEIIRVVYAARQPDPELLARVRSYFSTPREQSTERIPLPMPIAKWQSLFGPRVTDANLFSTILLNRRAALLCYGLLQLDRETLATVTSDAGLLRRLYERHSGVFAAFAEVLQVRGGRLVLPGGDDHAAAWVALDAGDDLHRDLLGARRAGLHAVLVDHADQHAEWGARYGPRVTRLADIAPIVDRLLV
jgi:hypothetical protein